MKKLFWIFYLTFLCNPFSLKSFKIYCTKIREDTNEEWSKTEELIRKDRFLSIFFKLK